MWRRACVRRSRSRQTFSSATPATIRSVSLPPPGHHGSARLPLSWLRIVGKFEARPHGLSSTYFSTETTMTAHTLFYYPYGSFANRQAPLLKAAALYFDKLYILDPEKASGGEIGAVAVAED